MCSSAVALLYDPSLPSNAASGNVPKMAAEVRSWSGYGTTGTHHDGREFSEDSTGRFKRCVSFYFCGTNLKLPNLALIALDVGTHMM